MNKTSKSLTAIILIIFFILSLGGCTSRSSSNSKINQIKKAGKIVVGTSAEYPPFEFHKEINGKDQIVGFDIEIAKEIAKDLGVELEIKDMKFDGLLAALQAGNIDFVIAGMTPTEERKKSVDFSKVYYKVVQKIAINSESIGKINTIDDLKGKKIGVQKGSVQEKMALETFKNSEIKSLSKIPDLIMELKTKKVDAVLIEEPVGASFAAKNSDVKLSSIELKYEDDGSAIAIKKGSEDVLESINKTLDRLMKDGSIEKFVTEATNQVENK